MKRYVVKNINGLRPEVGSVPRVLILGTIPGEKTLKTEEDKCKNKQANNETLAYYADPKNRFWKIIEQVFNNREPLKNDIAKKACLHNNGIALWDVLASCDRVNSSDRSIKHPVFNDIGCFLNKHKTISHIIFNGKKAKKYFDQLSPLDQVKREITLIVVPSTSGGNNMNNKWKDVTTGNVVVLKDKMGLWEKAFSMACSSLTPSLARNQRLVIIQ